MNLYRHIKIDLAIVHNAPTVKELSINQVQPEAILTSEAPPQTDEACVATF